MGIADKIRKFIKLTEPRNPELLFGDMSTVIASYNVAHGNQGSAKAVKINGE